MHHRAVDEGDNELGMEEIGAGAELEDWVVGWVAGDELPAVTGGNLTTQ